MNPTPSHTIEDLKLLMAQLIKSQKETDKKFQDTDKKFQDTQRLVKNLSLELGGIGKSNGQIAEDFFYTALATNMKIGKLQFDYIDRGLHRKRKTTEGEYDIILYNDYKVLVVEVKYNFKKSYLQKFYKNLKNFRNLFPEYSQFKLYGAIAGMTFADETIEDATEYGFYILTQNNREVKIINTGSFQPNEIK